MAVAVFATSNGWGHENRTTIIDGRTFEYKYFEGTGYTNIVLYKISPTAGDIVIPDRIDGTTDIQLGTSPVGGISIAGKDTTSVHLPPTVTSIYDSTFKDCTSLTNINLDCVTSFAPFAFDGCTNLEVAIHVTTNTSFRASSYNATLGHSMTFRNCSKIKDIIIDEGVTTLGKGTGAFWGTGIEHITLPSTLKSLAPRTFCYSALREITLPDSLEDVGGSFIECKKLGKVYIGSGLSEIKPDGGGYAAFERCSALTSVVFSANSSLKTIDCAFAGCTSLKCIDIPEGVVKLKSAFSNTGLRDIVIPSSVKIIYSAFSGCASLTNATMLGKVESMPYAFSGCSSLVSATVPQGVTNMTGAFNGCSSLLAVKIPDSTISISGAFSGCSSLTAIEIPASIRDLGSSTFSGCTGIPEIVIPNTITNIGDYAFQNYRGRLVFGNPTPRISYRAFTLCYPSKFTAYGGLPSPKANMSNASKSSRYVVTVDYLHEWLPWFEANKITNWRVLDGESGIEADVSVTGDDADARIKTVGVVAALGLSPARYVGTNGTVRLAYEKPTVTITEFDPVAGRVAANVAPAVGSRISDALIAECIRIEWSDDLKEWAELSEMEVNADNYGETGTFRCNFDSSGHCFYRVKVTGRQ